MQMTFDNYILNPAGKNNAVLNATAREAMRTAYINKFDAILLREKGNINYRLYKNEKTNRFIAHFMIPSETVDRFYYDTIIEFYTDKNVEESGNNLFKYNVRFYSNDPSFVYTYAYVFNKNDMFIKELKPKMSKKAIKEGADEKNPNNQIGYVKSIYFAYLFMRMRSLNNIDTFKAVASKLDFNILLANVMDADIKIDMRQREGEKVRKKNSSEKKKSERTISSTPNSKVSSNTSIVKSVSTTKTVSKTKIVGKTKNSKRK